MPSGWRRDGEVCSPEVVEGMQVNIGIGMIAGVSLLNFEDLFWSGPVRRGLMSRERWISMKPVFTSGEGHT